MFKVPEQYRLKNKLPLGTDASYGNNGVFIIPIANDCTACCVASDGMSWEHVSLHVLDEDGQVQTPAWEEMCEIKNLFWSEEDCVVQYHPPKSEYVNNHEHVLHLWRPVGIQMPTPSSVLVGIKEDKP